MPWNGTGSFTRVYSWVQDAANAINITASRMDTDTNDMTNNGFGNCITRDGQGVPSANLPMAGFKHTGVADGTARTHYAAIGQLQDNEILFAAAAGSADALTVSISPAPTAIVDGMQIYVRASAANATTTPTLALNGLTAWTITKNGASALAVGDIPAASAECIFRANLAGTKWELLNPAANSFIGDICDIAFIIDGAGAAITTGIKGDLEIPFACTINRATLLADQSGSIVVNVWKDTYANYPPTVADKITASAPPTITTATKSQDSTLTGWTTSISAGDTLRFNVDSITTVQRVTLSLKVTKT